MPRTKIAQSMNSLRGLALCFSLAVSQLAIPSSPARAEEPPAVTPVEAPPISNDDPGWGPQPAIPLNHCSFGITADKIGPPCRAEFSVCFTTDTWCVQHLTVLCGPKILYNGLYTTTFGPQIVMLSGAPFADVVDIPVIALYFRSPDRRPDSFMFAVLNLKGKNRNGDCHIERHPIPLY